MPKVSVLMPVYKTSEKYLREAIESILNQTFEDFEFLILDDCPEDDREEIVRSYKDKQKAKMQQATLSIWSFVKVENPALHEEFLLKAKRTKRTRLFGFIPFLTTITQANRTKTYLFEKILLFTTKEVMKLKGK